MAVCLWSWLGNSETEQHVLVIPHTSNRCWLHVTACLPACPDNAPMKREEEEEEECVKLHQQQLCQLREAE